MKRRRWMDAERYLLTKVYPDLPTKDIAMAFGRKVGMIYQAADRLKLKKSVEYLASPDACRLRRPSPNSILHQYPKGHAPHNKGKLGWNAGGRSLETRFRKGGRSGAALHNWKPIGSTRISKDGYLQRKITDTGYPPRDWRGEHIILWEQEHGPLPKGHAVIFKDRDKSHIEPGNLECVTRGELMRRNSVHRLPKELALVIQLKGALRRKLRTMQRKRDGKEQN